MSWNGGEPRGSPPVVPRGEVCWSGRIRTTGLHPPSGLPTGKRKETDKSTPLFYQMLVTNENLPEVKIKFWRSNAAGAEVQFYTIVLTNANVASMATTMLNNKHMDLMKYAEYDEIAFIYQKIDWTITDGGISAGDDWEAPTA